MKRILIAATAALALTFAGCAQVQNGFDVISTVTSAEVSPKQAYVAINTFDGMKVTATQYLRLPRCDGQRYDCRNPEATRVLIIAVDEGTVARNELKRSARRGGTSGYAALSIAMNAMQQTFTQYKIGRP